jgi:hypothetical protein
VVDDYWYPVDFYEHYSGYANRLVALAAIETLNDSDISGARLVDVNTDGLRVKVEEEQSLDAETLHGFEEIAYLFFEKGIITGLAGVEIGEAGVATHAQPDGNTWYTVPLLKNYADPVVMADMMEHVESDPAHVRIRNVTANSFEYQIEEWDYLDQAHAAADVGYVVIESGEHTMANGKNLVAGTRTASHAWYSIWYPTPFLRTPLTFSQCQTYNEDQAVETRHRWESELMFDVRLQEEEANDDRHADETVGYIACEAMDPLDTDGDGVPDEVDDCPGDAAKTDPGVCGCGSVDSDGDGDGVPDCIDCNAANPVVNDSALEMCTDGVDNDCNGLTDCDDGACASYPACQCDTSETSCTDGLDNDCDGAVDCDDTADCSGDPACPTCDSYTTKTTCNADANCTWEGSPKKGSCVDAVVCTPEPEICDDGIDNDCDESSDCADPDCTDAPNCICTPNELPSELTCGDGLDNDCDGSMDCDDPDCDGIDPCIGPVCGDYTNQDECNAAPGCEWQGKGKNAKCVDACTGTEDPEVSCDDGVDNDCDGNTDCSDPDCEGTAACDCVPEICDDGIDNDCDGKTDCTDKGDCRNDPACS